MDIRAFGVTSYCNSFVISLAFLFPILIFLFGRRKPQLPPGPFAWPVIGNIFNLVGKHPHIALANLAEAYGPLISLRFGAKMVMVASSPTAAREIFKIHDRDLSGRFEQHLASRLPQLYTTIAMSIECNEMWRFLRGTAHTELFSAKAMESHSQARLGKTKDMINFLGSKAGQVVNVTEVLFATSANIVTNAMTSQDIIQSLENIGEVKRYTKKIVEFATPGLADLYPAIGGLDFWSKQKAADYNAFSELMWGDIVSKRRAMHDIDASSRNMLDILIENSFDDSQIYNFLTELHVSSETVSTALDWAMAELIRNQKAFAKLRDELAETIEGTTLSENHLTRLPYLQACIKETLRLHPPSPFLVPRSALETCKIMNYEIPKNCLVLVNAYVLGRDPETWEDPQDFKPERFLGKSLDVKGTNYELLPFGGGRRICAGFPLALKQIQLLLASLVYAFDWFLPSGTDPANLNMSEKFGITLARENPLQLIPKIRNDLHKDWL